MTPYIILILTIDILVLVGMTVHGWKKGFAYLISKVISLIASIVVVMLLSSMISGYQKGNVSNLVVGVLLLVIMGVLYKVIHAILTSIRILAGLPILGGVDRVLGVAIGFLEGFSVLYIGEYMLRMYLLH